MGGLKTMQFTGDKESVRRLSGFIVGYDIKTEVGFSSSSYVDIIKIPTREGDKVVTVGDYIVKNDDGGFSVYNPDLFHELYDIL